LPCKSTCHKWASGGIMNWIIMVLLRFFNFNFYSDKPHSATSSIPLKQIMTISIWRKKITMIWKSRHCFRYCVLNIPITSILLFTKKKKKRKEKKKKYQYTSTSVGQPMYQCQAQNQACPHPTIVLMNNSQLFVWRNKM
jgi:hypothetical protein